MRALRPVFVACLVSSVVGCSNDSADLVNDGSYVPPLEMYGDTAATDGEMPLVARIDVIPPDSLASPSGETYLPQTFTADASGATDDLVLDPPVRFEGTVAAYDTSPYRDAGLPGVGGLLAGALVSVRKAASVQSANDVTSAGSVDAADLGAFHLVLPPDGSYVVSYVPNDPELPFRSAPLALLDDATLAVDLGAGAAVWGTVTDADGAPLVGVAVRAVASDGLEGTAAITDADGDYLLRVEPGAWTIRSEGRSSGRDPVLTESVTVPAEGRSVDFTYGSLDLVSIGGRVVDDRGQGLTSVRVHLTSNALLGYDGASYDVEVLTNRDGNFDTRVLRGDYTVEVVPDRNLELSAASLGDVVVDDAFEDLGETVLPSFAQVLGAVLDGASQPVPGAVVTLREVGYDQRSWSVTAGDSGAFFVMAPRTAVQAWIAPPADRADLANKRIAFEPSSETAPVFVLSEGVLFSGTVLAADAGGTDRPVPFAVVEVVDDRGDRWAGALTDEDGRYSVRVDWAR